jgi:hypothetical protein
MLPYELNYLFSLSAQLHPPEVIGPVAEGIRANFYVASGEVSGPRVNGILRPVGGDWLIVRSDGVGMLDVRATVETHDSAFIYLVYSGVADLGAEGYQAFVRGELPPQNFSSGSNASADHPSGLSMAQSTAMSEYRRGRFGALDGWV